MKRYVKANDYDDSVAIYYNNEKVFEGDVGYAYDDLCYILQKDAETKESAIEYLNSFGDPLIDEPEYAVVPEIVSTLIRFIQLELWGDYAEESEFLDNFYISEIKNLEIFPAKQQIESSTKTQRTKKAKKFIKAERIFELSPQYDSRKSFYGKAKVLQRENGDLVLHSYDTPVATIRNGKRVPEEEYRASQTTNRHIKEFYRQFEDASTDIDKQEITAATHSASELVEFMKESVAHLLGSEATNNRYILDSDWAIYVGWSDAGYTDDFESVIHDEAEPSWVICCKIATTHEYVWADYDFCDMPYDENTGEVWDTDMAISPEENYQQTASWLLDQYNELIGQIESGEFVPHKYH